jgi:hypothetical protein
MLSNRISQARNQHEGDSKWLAENMRSYIYKTLAVLAACFMPVSC